jgi:hypothetical protein
MNTTLRGVFAIIISISLIGLPLTPVQSAPLAESANWQLVKQIGGSTLAVAAQDGLLFAGEGTHIIQLDPTSLGLLAVSNPLTNQIEDLVYANGNLYAAEGTAGLARLDAASLATAVPQTQDTNGVTQNLAIRGDRLLVADGAGGVVLTDLSLSPKADSTAVLPVANITDVAVDPGTNIIIAAASTDGIYALDTTGDTFSVTSHLETVGSAEAVWLDGSNVYIADSWGGVVTASLNPDGSLTQLGQVDLPGWAMDLKVGNGFAYIADGVNGFWVVDVSGMRSPRIVSGLPYHKTFWHDGNLIENREYVGFFLRVALDGNRAFLADTRNGIRSVDISLPGDPQPLGIYRPLSTVRRVMVDDRHLAFVAALTSGIRILDVSQPADPEVVFEYNDGSSVNAFYIDPLTHVAFAGQQFLTGSEMIYMVDTSNTEDIQKLPGLTQDDFGGQENYNCANRDLVTTGTHLFVAGEWHHFVFDISNPAEPVMTEESDIHPVAAAASGNTIISAESGQGWSIMTLDPMTGKTTQSFHENQCSNAPDCPDFHVAEEAFMVGNLAYLAAEGLPIYDVTAPENPERKSYDPISIPSTPYSVMVADSKIFVAMGAGGVMVAGLNINGVPEGDPTYIDTAGYAWDAWYDVPTQTLYVADGNNGLLMYQREGMGSTLPLPKPNHLASLSTTSPKTRSQQVASQPLSQPSKPEIQPVAGLTSCVVSKTADTDTSGSLRYCIENVATGGSITFSTTTFPKSAPARITLNSPLPPLTAGSVSLDASKAGVILDANGLDNALTVMSSKNRVSGLQVTNFRYTGIKVENMTWDNVIGGNRNLGQGNTIYGATPGAITAAGIFISGEGNKVQGNWVGLRPDGTGDGFHWGIFVSDWSLGALIGGTEPGQGNLLSGNLVPDGTGTGMGMDIFGFETRVVGNWFGLAPDGLRPLAEFGSEPWHPNNAQPIGITLESTAVNSIIGGSTPAERNIFSGNGKFGIIISDPSSMQNQIMGNWFGTDKYGRPTIGISEVGMLYWNVTYNKVGGLEPGEGNTFVIWGGRGIDMAGQDVHHNVILGNRFLLADKPSTDDTRKGVEFRDEFRSVLVGNSFNGVPVGIKSTGAGLTMNVIMKNVFQDEITGIQIGDYSSQNALLGNQFFDNGTGINVEGSAHDLMVRGNIFDGNTTGVSADNTTRKIKLITNTYLGNTTPIMMAAADAPSAPVIISATISSVSGSAEPNGYIEIYTARQGGYLKPYTTGMIDGGGVFTIPVNLWWGPGVTALSTRPDGSTSAFSSTSAVTGVGSLFELLLPIGW